MVLRVPIPTSTTKVEAFCLSRLHLSITLDTEVQSFRDTTV